MALTLRGKSAKFFNIKPGDTALYTAMWDYVDTFLRTIVFDILGTAPELIRGEMISEINRNRINRLE